MSKSCRYIPPVKIHKFLLRFFFCVPHLIKYSPKSERYDLFETKSKVSTQPPQGKLEASLKDSPLEGPTPRDLDFTKIFPLKVPQGAMVPHTSSPSL